MSDVKISIVTPSFNQARFLDETLRSVLSQRDQIHEYFVIDGGSTDGSREIIERHACAGGIDYWVSEKDAGQSDAIQKGFARATGNILAWLNSDDLYLPGVLAKVRAAFESHPDWDVLTGWHVRIDADSRIRTLHRIPCEKGSNARWGIHHVNQQTWFFKKSLYDRVGPINTSLHCVMDADLWCRMFDANAKWGHIPEYLAAFREHADAKNSSWIEKYRAEDNWMRKTYPQYCAENFKHRCGLLAYRASQVLTGRHLAALSDIKRYNCKTISEVFGPYTNV